MASVVDLPPVSKFFIPLPEANLKTKRRTRLGHVYLCEDLEEGARLFLDAVTHGIPGLWISARLPEDLRKRWKLSTTPILWITQKESREEVTAKPRELGRIMNIVKHYFLEGIPRAVLFLDCLSVLIRKNGMLSTLGMLKELKNTCERDHAALILSLSGLEQKQKTLVKKLI